MTTYTFTYRTVTGKKSMDKALNGDPKDLDELLKSYDNHLESVNLKGTLKLFRDSDKPYTLESYNVIQKELKRRGAMYFTANLYGTQVVILRIVRSDALFWD